MYLHLVIFLAIQFAVFAAKAYFENSQNIKKYFGNVVKS